jgi:hypothetical protein
MTGSQPNKGSVGHTSFVSRPLMVSRNFHVPLLVTISLIVVIGFTSYVQAPVVVVGFLLFAVAGWLITTPWGSAAARLFFVVYCLSTVFAIILYFVYVDRYGVPYYIGGSDDLAYEEWGKSAAQIPIWDYTSIRGGVVASWHNSPGYVYIVGLLYRFGELLGGFNTMLPRLLNAAALALIAAMSYRLALLYEFSARTSFRLALLVGLLPIMMFNAAHTFRDTLASFLSIWIVYNWVKVSVSPRNRVWIEIQAWLLTILVFVILNQIRSQQAIAVLVVAIISAVIPRAVSAGKLRNRNLPTAFVTGVLAIAFLVMLVGIRGDVDQDVTGWVNRLDETQESYAEYRLGLAGDGLSRFVFGADPPLSYVLRTLYALITPLPVLTTEVERLWISIGTVVQYLFLPFLGLGIIYSALDRSKWILLLAFALFFGGTAVVSFTSRHISQFLPYGVLIAAIGFRNSQRNRNALLFLTAYLGLWLAILYATLVLL